MTVFAELDKIAAELTNGSAGKLKKVLEEVAKRSYTEGFEDGKENGRQEALDECRAEQEHIECE